MVRAAKLGEAEFKPPLSLRCTFTPLHFHSAALAWRSYLFFTLPALGFWGADFACTLKSSASLIQ